MSVIKKKQTFKEYYDSNPEFREKHLNKLRERIICECGKSVARSNLSRHKKTTLHIKHLNCKTNELAETKKKLRRLERIIKNSDELAETKKKMRRMEKIIKKNNL